MPEIRPLIEINAEDLHRVIAGYTSPARYRVERVETPERICFSLELEALDSPFVKNWPLTEDDLRRYETIVEDGLSLGAYEGGRLIGLALAEAQAWNRSLLIWEFHVEEAYRRQGVGSAMMNLLASKARAAGLRIMVVETQSTNLPAIQFYRRLGFAIEAVDTAFYTNHDLEPDGEVALWMKRRLES